MLERLNYRSNKNIDLGASLLNGQGSGPLSICRLGLFPMSYNGCEMIAAYNLRLLMGKPKPLSEITREIYPYGVFFWGIFGTNPLALKRYFRENGLPVQTELDDDRFRQSFAGAQYGILSFWNSDKTIFKGIHTVAVENTPDGLKVYNCTNRQVDPVTFPSLDAYMQGKKFICGYYAEPNKKVSEKI